MIPQPPAPACPGRPSTPDRRCPRAGRDAIDRWRSGRRSADGAPRRPRVATTDARAAVARRPPGDVAGATVADHRPGVADHRATAAASTPASVAKPSRRGVERRSASLTIDGAERRRPGRRRLRLRPDPQHAAVAPRPRRAADLDRADDAAAQPSAHRRRRRRSPATSAATVAARTSLAVRAALSGPAALRSAWGAPCARRRRCRGRRRRRSAPPCPC